MEYLNACDVKLTRTKYLYLIKIHLIISYMPTVPFLVGRPAFSLFLPLGSPTIRSRQLATPTIRNVRLVSLLIN